MLNWLEEILPFCCSRIRNPNKGLNGCETDSKKLDSSLSTSNSPEVRPQDPDDSFTSSEPSETLDRLSEQPTPIPDFYFSFHSEKGFEEKSSPFNIPPDSIPNSENNVTYNPRQNPQTQSVSEHAELPYFPEQLRRIRTDPVKPFTEYTRFQPKKLIELPCMKSESRGETKFVFNESSKNSTADSRRNSGKAAVIQDYIESANSVLGKCYIEQFECIGCQQSAKGFCIGCPGKRFCEECYDKSHVSLSMPHKFCAYKIFKKQLFGIKKSIIKLHHC